MNSENNGLCNTEGMEDEGEYEVPADDQGRSPLTGSSYIQYGGKRFTCTELEVFAL